MPEPNVSWVIDRFENGQAVLVWQKQELVVPKKYLPAQIKEGEVIVMELYRQKDEKARRENLARHILDEILTPSSR